MKLSLFQDCCQLRYFNIKNKFIQSFEYILNTFKSAKLDNTGIE